MSTLTKTDLIDLIAKKLDCTKVAAKEHMDCLFDVIGGQLKKNREVEGFKIQIMGFGTFRSKFVAGRQGINPKDPTGNPVTIPDSYRLFFSAGQPLKDRVNGEAKAPTAKAPTAKTPVAKATPTKAPVKAPAKKK